jgi:outer membrane protein OmpA-like peptidoglycan-associated protein
VHRVSRLLFAGLIILSVPTAADPVQTEISGVTAELLDLRQTNGVLRLAVRYANTTDAVVRFSDPVSYGAIALVDAKTKQKHFALKDADGKFLGGPISDWNGGGRWWPNLSPHGEAVVWLYFEPVAPGSVVSVSVPKAFPFDDVPVSEGPSTFFQPASASSTPAGLTAELVSAKRADQQLKVQLKLARGAAGPSMSDSALYFKDVFVFDPASKRKYLLLKDDAGHFEARPSADANEGGRVFLSTIAPGGAMLISMTFLAPPDDVQAADLVLPHFVPFVKAPMSGTGGAVAGGIAAAGSSLGLEGALKELQAEVTPQEIKIDLSADVLFDFDKSDLKPAAEAQLNNLLTVVNSRPNAAVGIEGHTDVRGDAAYNQTLSERRADSVRIWLVSHGVAPGRLTATGAGETRPLRPGNTEADHQANRRVEIRIKGAKGTAAAEEAPRVAFPLALHTKWRYHLHEELGEGVHFGPADAVIANGRVLDTSAVSEVTGTDTINGESFARIDTKRTGNPWLTEWYRITPTGLLVGKTVDHEAQQVTLMVPPQKILSADLKSGDSWVWRASDRPVNMSFKVVGAVPITVPAGAFSSIEISDDAAIQVEANTLNVRQSRWFVPGVGYAKQDTKVSMGERFLTHTVLNLEKYEPAASP